MNSEDTITTISSGKTPHRIRFDAAPERARESTRIPKHPQNLWEPCPQSIRARQRVMREEGTTSQTFDFGDGKGLVPAYRHRNPDATLGGWVADTACVEPTAYIGPNARVFGRAWVFQKARISGNAKVFGDAWVFGNARIGGNARVFGQALIFGNALIFDDAAVLGKAWVAGNTWVFGSETIYHSAQLFGR